MKGEKLKALRIDNGLTQKDLAELIGIGKRGRTTISEWENDRKNMSVANHKLLTELLA